MMMIYAISINQSIKSRIYTCSPSISMVRGHYLFAGPVCDRPARVPSPRPFARDRSKNKINKKSCELWFLVVCGRHSSTVLGFFSLVSFFEKKKT